MRQYSKGLMDSKIQNITLVRRELQDDDVRRNWLSNIELTYLVKQFYYVSELSMLTQPDF
jgi:hypothetical protein